VSQKAALVIDDSKSIRFAMRKLLEAQSYTVALAETAEIGLEQLKTVRPDVIFLDHLLPGISGFEVLRKIKSDAKTVTIPVVICSSQEGEEFVTMVRSRGALDVLHKPPNADLIKAVLDRLEKVAATLRGEGAKPAAPPPPAAAPTEEGRRDLLAQIDELRAQIAELEAEVTALEDAEPDPAKLRQQIRDELKSLLAGTREELRQEARTAAGEIAQEIAQKVVSAAGNRIVEQVKAQIQKAQPGATKN
jgi:DNA-binding response OmpR family regulator